jgi:AcrR family transcriptional regulator
MREIAEDVGVSKAALYYHFNDKEELLLAVLEAYLDEIGALFDNLQRDQTTCRQQICFLVESILAQPVEQRALIRLSSQEMPQLSGPARQSIYRAYHEKFIDRIQAIMEAGMNRKELRPIDPAIAAWTLLGMLYPYFYPIHASDLPEPANVAEAITSIFLDGIARE